MPLEKLPFEALCCFCGNRVEQKYPDPCTIVVSAAKEDEWQQWYCHANCFSERLADIPRAENRLF